MKIYYTLFILLLVSVSIDAQIIDIPDANFKNALVNTNCVDTDSNGAPDSDVDTNDDGEVDINEALATSNLYLSNRSISSLTGIENFTNLTGLDLNWNNITLFSFDGLENLSGLTIRNNALTTLEIIDLQNLIGLDCGNNFISSLEIMNAPNIEILSCYGNQMTSLTLGNLPNLRELDCSENQLTSLDLSETPLIDELYVAFNHLTVLDLSTHEVPKFHLTAENNQLTTIFMKNGFDDAAFIQDIDDEGFFTLGNNPELTYICADDEEFDKISWILENNGIDPYIVNSYCTFESGGDFYTIEGSIRNDLGSDGCDVDDAVIPNLNLEVTNGSETGNFISNSSGDYSIPVGVGMHSISPILENPSYYSITPASISVDFPSDGSPYIQDFCISPNGTFNDLEITIFPLVDARPGFDADYKIVYKNKGTTSLSGNIALTFQDDLMDLVSANPSEDTQALNMLNWNFNDLMPFESREIDITMNINSPMETPPVNGDDILIFNASISSSQTDETPEDNSLTLNQTVVNSFDPNDKTCLEGNTITPEQVGEFVHYRIRFENTGTANAINVVVKDDIDRTKYDLSTLVPIDASHDFVARIKDNASDYYVEFIFENINLPFDDANNDGYVVFKIKTLDTLVLGDTFENDAEIYFDFNFPIITNNEQTTVATLSTEDFELTDDIVLFPNPTTHSLHLKAKQSISQISIYDISGRQVLIVSVIGYKNEIELSTEELSAGTYVVKIKSDSGEITRKIIKH